MIRIGTLFWLVLVSTTAFAMFGVKFQVQALEDELARINKATAADEHEIRVLDAEWAYLTRPETLDAMNRQFLSLVPISTKQLRTTVADIPMRPPPPAPPPALGEPETVVAAVGGGPPMTSAPPSGLDGVPASGAAPTKSEVEPRQTKSALSVMPALLEKSSAAPQVAKAPSARPAVRPSTPRRAKSLDDLIAQIMASR
jgi:hypothetical protein